MSTDPRIVMGAACTWWDSIYHCGVGPNGLPACPYCAGPLYEADSLEAWMEGIEEFQRESGDENYTAFITWLRGKPCVRQADLPFAREIFERRVMT